MKLALALIVGGAFAACVHVCLQWREARDQWDMQEERGE